MVIRFGKMKKILVIWFLTLGITVCSQEVCGVKQQKEVLRRQKHEQKKNLRMWCYVVAAVWFKALPLGQLTQPFQLEAIDEDDWTDVA